MTLAIAVMGARPAHAQEEPPASLLERALRTHGYDRPAHTSALSAAWMPRVRLHTIVERVLGGRGSDETVVWGELAWPLGRRPVDDAVVEQEARRQTLNERDRLIDRIADVWRRRQRERDQGDDALGALRLQESQAELDALTGDSERGP